MIQRTERFACRTSIRLPLAAAFTVIVFAAMLAILQPSAVKAQTAKPILVGNWPIEAAIFGYDKPDDPSESPQYNVMPAGACVMHLTHQKDRVFGGRIVCGGSEGSSKPFTGALLTGGELQLLVAEDFDNRTWCFGKLSADGESLVIEGACSTMEDPGVAQQPGFGSMTFTARQLP